MLDVLEELVVSSSNPTNTATSLSKKVKCKLARKLTDKAILIASKRWHFETPKRPDRCSSLQPHVMIHKIHKQEHDRLSLVWQPDCMSDCDDRCEC